MTKTNDREPRRKDRRGLWPYPIVIVLVSLLALVSTFVLTNSEISIESKSRGFSVVIATYLVFCACLYLWQNQRAATVRKSDGNSDIHIESRLLAFDEANEFFGGSLKRADMFRLVSSRIGELIPFQTSALFLLDDTRARLQVVESAGSNCEELIGRSVSFDNGLTGKCYISRAVVLGTEHDEDMETSTSAAAKSARTTVAIPIVRGEDVFGVIQLYLFSELNAQTTDVSLFEAIGTRVSPLIMSSVALDRSISNALTDPTTTLPNERAFFLILENQIAESQRKRDERPLTIVSIDIKNFDEINSKYGHAAGDRVLNFVAQTVKSELRQMDFFARASHDEFLTILPTATEQVSWDVMARVQTAFLGNRLKINDVDSIQVDLNYGWAGFWKDGETAEQLLKAARLRKQQSKSTDPQKVLWFPKEFVN